MSATGSGGTHRSRPTKCDETVCHSTGPWRWVVAGLGGAEPRPYEWLPIPFAIYPPLAVSVTLFGGTRRSRPTKCDETGCHSTGWGGGRCRGAAGRAPVTAREVRVAAGTSALGVVVAPYGDCRYHFSSTRPGWFSLPGRRAIRESPLRWERRRFSLQGRFMKRPCGLPGCLFLS